MSIIRRVEAARVVPDGSHVGVVTRAEARNVKFEKKGKTKEATYIDIYIETKHGDENIELKWGAPDNISPNSKLGKTMANFIELKAGEDVDIEAVMVGKKVSFITMQSDSGFAEIVDGSIKPVQEQPATPSQQPPEPKEPASEQSSPAEAPSGAPASSKLTAPKSMIDRAFNNTANYRRKKIDSDGQTSLEA